MISGSCTQDYGSFTLMPLSRRLEVLPEVRASRFSHRRETATPAYYAVTLDDEGIRAEATGRKRSLRGLRVLREPFSPWVCSALPGRLISPLLKI